MGDAVWSEDVVGEEAVDEIEEHVFADVLPFAMAERLGCFVDGDAVGAGVVGDALALFAVHAKRVVAGCAVDDSAQEVGAALTTSAPRAFTAGAVEKLCGCSFEPFVGDQCLVPLLRFDPFPVGTTDHWPFTELRLPKVEAVPVEPPCVDRVGEDRADGRLWPLARRVASAVDVTWGRRAARAVEVVGDLFEARTGEVPIEDLDDDRSLVGIGNESGLVVSCAGAAWIGMRLMVEPVAVGRRRPPLGDSPGAHFSIWPRRVSRPSFSTSNWSRA